jgi:hypothetical protein
MINEYGAVETRNGRGTEVLREKPAQCLFVHLKFHMT